MAKNDKKLRKFTNLLNRKEAIHCVYFSFVCLVPFFLGVYTTWIGWGDIEKGRPGERSKEEVDILLFIPDLQRISFCKTQPSMISNKTTDPHRVLEVGEKSSIWDTDRLRPRKSGALLGNYIPVTLHSTNLQFLKKRSKKGKLFSMRSKSALGPTYLTWGRRLSLRCLNRDLCLLIKTKRSLPNLIQPKPNIKRRYAQSPEVVLTIEVVKEAGGGHARGQRLVPRMIIIMIMIIIIIILL